MVWTCRRDGGYNGRGRKRHKKKKKMMMIQDIIHLNSQSFNCWSCTIFIFIYGWSTQEACAAHVRQGTCCCTHEPPGSRSCHKIRNLAYFFLQHACGSQQNQTQKLCRYSYHSSVSVCISVEYATDIKKNHQVKGRLSLSPPPSEDKFTVAENCTLVQYS